MNLESGSALQAVVVIAALWWLARRWFRPEVDWAAWAEAKRTPVIDYNFSKKNIEAIWDAIDLENSFAYRAHLVDAMNETTAQMVAEQERQREERRRQRLEDEALFDFVLSEFPSSTPTPVESAAPATDVQGVIHFKSDEPKTLDAYGSQQHVVRPLSMAIRALADDEVVLDHKLMTGPPGLGKTLLSKVIANELQTRARERQLCVPVFVETYAANLNSIEALDQVVQTLVKQPASIWFIDEIHVLDKELATKIYLLMEEGRYPFDGSLNPTLVPNVMVIGATTDYGTLHAALKRRFNEPLMLRTMTREELETLAPKLGFPIDPEAVSRLVSRCHQSGAPYELKILFNECAVFATAHGLDTIDEYIVDEVFDTYEIDEHGLRAIDRTVLETLFKRPRYRGKAQEFYCFGGSESDVCAVARLDKAEFQETIRPRLMSRGFLEVRSGVGLALTSRAVESYTHLNPNA